MLYFSKLKLFIIYFVIIFLSFFSFVNFIDVEENYILSKKVNLGLDLQGGSYLLLEVDSRPIVKQKLQNKLISLRKSLKDEKIKYRNLKIKNEKKDKVIIIKYIKNNLIFEKYNTKYNYFFVSDLFKTLCIVD